MVSEIDGIDRQDGWNEFHLLIVRRRRISTVESLTSNQRADIDALILAGSIIPGMVYIKNSCGVSLPDARNLFKARYRELRAMRGAEFGSDDQQYWSCYGQDLADAIAKGW